MRSRRRVHDGTYCQSSHGIFQPLSPVRVRGCARGEAAGADGFIVVDLPRKSGLNKACIRTDCRTVLVAPTSSDKRIQALWYSVDLSLLRSVTGVTGARNNCPSSPGSLWPVCTKQTVARLAIGFVSPEMAGESPTCPMVSLLEVLS
jgi:tryptophan synthase alpha subunit